AAGEDVTGVDVAIVVPTRDRPAKLARCLQSQEPARRKIGASVRVCDSSTRPDLRNSVRQICANYPFVTLTEHGGANVAAARNECVRVANADILVIVDDDILVMPDAVDRL